MVHCRPASAHELNPTSKWTFAAATTDGENWSKERSHQVAVRCSPANRLAAAIAAVGTQLIVAEGAFVASPMCTLRTQAIEVDHSVSTT